MIIHVRGYLFVFVFVPGNGFWNRARKFGRAWKTAGPVGILGPPGRPRVTPKQNTMNAATIF